MATITIAIGGRSFEVACKDGEEDYLHNAASMLDAEAASLSDQIGRLPEAQMLLMAGLMLADKTAAMEQRAKAAEAPLAEAMARIADLEGEIAAGTDRPAPAPERIEVPVEVPVEVRFEVMPAHVVNMLTELACRAEAIAKTVEVKAQHG